MVAGAIMWDAFSHRAVTDQLNVQGARFESKLEKTDLRIDMLAGRIDKLSERMDRLGDKMDKKKC
ncbi:hypothetical protein TWF718_006050 [Orbilia javanica]|uniref:Uncharacterized protein n=1 Tax=Orbilia javanica TaxID=47235 RepID=A0AAN8N2L0_9PEZI